MKSMTSVAVALAVLGVAAPSASAQQQPMRSVNITSESAPGWLPSVEQEKMAQEAALDFLQAKDQSRYADAYAMYAPAMKSRLRMDQFAETEQKFHAMAGPLVSRKIEKVTWTKDPASGPFPGVFAAIDVTTKYANVDRHCGYVVAYQQPSGGAFLVMREERTFLDNETAAKIKAGGQNVEGIWARISRVCPNYSPTEPAG